MQGLHKEIYDLQKRIKENEQKIYFKFAELGKIIIKSDPDKIANTVLIDTFNEIHKLNKIEPQKNDNIKSILEIEKNLEIVRTRIKEKRKEALEQEKATKQHFQNIGESAFRVYKENQGINEAFKLIFYELSNLDEKMDKNDQGRKDFKDVNQMNRKENFLKQFVNIAKSIFYEKKQDILISRQNTLYGQVGRKVMESEFLQVNEDQVLDDLAIPLKTLLARIEQIKQELTNLVESEKKILQELNELNVRGNAVKRIKEIENEIAENRKNIDIKHQELGRLYYFNNKEVKIQFPEIVEHLNIVKMLFSENDGYKESIKKLNARIEIQSIKEKILKNNKTIENLKSKMDKEKEDVAAITQTNAGYDAEIVKITKENKLEN